MFAIDKKKCTSVIKLEFCFPSTSMFHIEVVGETKLTVSLGASIKCLLTHDKWHVLLQSENVFELGGKNIRFLRTAIGS